MNALINLLTTKANTDDIFILICIVGALVLFAHGFNSGNQR